MGGTVGTGVAVGGLGVAVGGFGVGVGLHCGGGLGFGMPQALTVAVAALSSPIVISSAKRIVLIRSVVLHVSL